MLLILLNWIIIFITCWGFGMVIMNFFEKQTSLTKDHNDLVLYLLTGLISLATIGIVISFFAPLNSMVSIILLIASIVFIALNKVQAKDCMLTLLSNFKSLHIIAKSGFVFIFLIALIKSSGPSELIDEGGYFLPYIRWIEEFKLVPGIANIEDRIGFNSSFHILCALFSFHDIYSDGLYELNGFVLITIGFYFVSGVSNLLRGNQNTIITDLAKTICLLFLFRNALTSSASDLSNVFFSELVLILYIEKIELQKLKNPDSNFILMLLSATFLITLKFSSSLLFLLVLHPLYYIYKQFPKFVILCSAVVLFSGSVWLIRSYYLSGYIVYPLHYIDFFNPDWKLPKDATISQYYYVGEFAKTNANRSVSEEYAKTRSIGEWVPIWFGRENTYNKLTAIILVLIFLWSLFFMPKNYQRTKHYIFLYLVLLLIIAVWFLKFPAFRFGWGPIIIFISLIITLTLEKTKLIRVYRYAMIVVFCLFTLQSLAKSFMENKEVLVSTITTPVPIPVINTTEIIIPPGLKVNQSEYYECWGASPPCLPSNYDRRIKARGEDVTDGFYLDQKEK